MNLPTLSSFRRLSTPSRTRLFINWLKLNPKKRYDSTDERSCAIHAFAHDLVRGKRHVEAGTEGFWVGGLTLWQTETMVRVIDDPRAKIIHTRATYGTLARRLERLLATK